MDTLKIAIAGAGRMGQSIAALVDAAEDISLAGIWKRGEDLDALVREADVIIDFSLPEGTVEVVAAAECTRTPMVCGVSGLDDAQMTAVGTAAKGIPIVYDRNMSLGVAVLTRSVAEAAAALGQEFSMHIEETHHIHKKDAPSGTALKLGEAVASACGETGIGSVTFESERSGEVPGDHKVTMTSPTETLAFSHSVTTREVFAAGAIRAARWVANREAGLYDMRDVLFSELG